MLRRGHQPRTGSYVARGAPLKSATGGFHLADVRQLPVVLSSLARRVTWKQASLLALLWALWVMYATAGHFASFRFMDWKSETVNDLCTQPLTKDRTGDGNDSHLLPWIVLVILL